VNHEQWTECQEKDILERRVLPANINTQLAWKVAIHFFLKFSLTKLLYMYGEKEVDLYKCKLNGV